MLMTFVSELAALRDQAVSHYTRPQNVGTNHCGMNGPVAHFVALWMGVVGERSSLMRCDERLVLAAHNHAQYTNKYADTALEQDLHRGLAGSTPNQRVRQSGYLLPATHGDDNTVESIMRVSGSAPYALQMFLESPACRPLLLGEGFWYDSRVYGVGNSGDIWVVVVCPREEF